MKRIVKIILVCIAFVTTSALSHAKSPVGIWKLDEEKGYVFPGTTDIIKIVSADGTFNVLWSYNNGESYILKQGGTWKEIAPGVILERPTVARIGDVIILYKVQGKHLYLNFSFPSQPKVARQQTYTKISKISGK